MSTPLLLKHGVFFYKNTLNEYYMLVIWRAGVENKRDLYKMHTQEISKSTYYFLSNVLSKKVR